MSGAGELQALRARIRAMEGGASASVGGVASLGPGLDARLPWGGLPRRALHEIAGPAGAATVALFARAFLAAHPGVLAWCLDDRTAERQGALYGPGLAAFGLGPERFLLVRCRDRRQTLWACAEALRSPATACAIAELDRLDLATGRRLQLAAEAGGGAGIVLAAPADQGGDPGPSAALTRWRARSLPISGPVSGPLSGPIPGPMLRLRLELWRAKGALPAVLEVAWDGQALALAPTAGLADPAAGARLPPAGPALAG